MKDNEVVAAHLAATLIAKASTANAGSVVETYFNVLDALNKKDSARASEGMDAYIKGQ